MTLKISLLILVACSNIFSINHNQITIGNTIITNSSNNIITNQSTIVHSDGSITDGNGNPIKIIVGSRKLISQTIPLKGSVNQLELNHGECSVINDGDHAITITADDNIMEYVQADGSKSLQLGLKPGSYQNATLKFTVSIPSVPQYIKTHGTANLIVDHNNTSKTTIETSGTSKVTVSKGHFAKFIAYLSGTSMLDAANVSAETAKIETSGVSECVIGRVDKLTATASGVSKIKYQGVPKVLQKYTSGLGIVEPW